jgi:DNA mismatch repair protein MutL
VEGGNVFPLKPSLSSPGTCVEVSDLFFATPARLKFLKSERSELLAIRQLMDQIAIAHPTVSFEVWDEKRSFLQYPKGESTESWDSLLRERLKLVVGETFSLESLSLQTDSSGYWLKGFLGLPTAHLSHSQQQFFFVNGRPVKDKILSSLVRVAYADILPMGRFPSVVLFLEVPLEKVDVNVHPAKTEVRFSETAFVKEFVLDGMKRILLKKGNPTSKALSQEALEAFRKSSVKASEGLQNQPSMKTRSFFEQSATPLLPPRLLPQTPVCTSPSLEVLFPHQPNCSEKEVLPEMEMPPFGYAIGQIHQSYIVSQNAEGFLIVDQHAAHERLLYEKLKASLKTGEVESEALLIPLMMSVTSEILSVLEDHRLSFQKCGLHLSPWGENTFILKSVPALLRDENWDLFLSDLLGSLSATLSEDLAYEDPLERALFTVVSTLACQRKSVRAGRKLSLEEMNQLLRDMEKTPNAAQCNHGRPTYIQLEMGQIEKLFRRHA